MGISSKSSIKGVQRGSISLANAVTSATATIGAVNPAKAELRFVGLETDQQVNSYTSCRLALTNATTITATRNTGIGLVVVGFEVTEWA